MKTLIQPSLLASLLLTLTACGGGGGGDGETTTPITPTPAPSVSEEEQNTELYTEFANAGGTVLVELPLASVESFFQLSSMANSRIQQSRNETGEITCQGNSQGEGQGSIVLNTSGLPLTADSVITVSTTDCYDPFLLAVTNGTYRIQLTEYTSNSWRYNLLLDDLSINDAGSVVELAGSLDITSTNSDSLVESLVQSTADEVIIRFIDGSDEFTETFTNINLTRTFDYVATQRSISGSFTENSGLMEEALQVTFSQPFIGALNRYPTSGELLVNGDTIAARVEVDSDGSGNYLAPVSFDNDGEFFAPETFTFNFDSILEGTLFLPPAPVFQESDTDVPADNGNSIMLIDSSGVPEASGDGSYLFSAGDELVFRFSRPVGFADDNARPTLILMGPENEQVDFFYEVEGGIVRITLPVSMTPSGTYRLQFQPQGSMELVYDFTVVKNLSLEVTSPLFGFAGESFSLDAEVLSTSGEYNNVTWQQVAGPDLGELSAQQSQTLTLPTIESDYQITRIDAMVSDAEGHTSEQSFTFVIVNPQLNRNLVFLPHAQSGPLVLSGDIKQSFSHTSNGLYQVGVDLFQQYATAYFSTSAITEGSFSANDEMSNAFFIETNPNLQNDEECNAGELPGFAPGVNARLHATNVALGEDGIAKGNFVVNRYCANLDEYHAQFGLLLRDNLFGIDGAGFLYPNSSQPLTLENANNTEVTFAVNPSDAVTIAQDLSQISTGAIPYNDAADITFTRAANGEILKENMVVDLIADLTGKAHIYFERFGQSNGANGGSALHQYTKSLIVPTDALDINLSLDKKYLNVVVNQDVEGLLATINLTLSTMSDFPIGEKVLIENTAESDHSLLISFNYMACENTGGSFTIHELETDADNNIDSLALDGYVQCYLTDENNNELDGFERMSIRINSNIPVNPVSGL